MERKSYARKNDLFSTCFSLFKDLFMVIRDGSYPSTLPLHVLRVVSTVWYTTSYLHSPPSKPVLCRPGLDSSPPACLYLLSILILSTERFSKIHLYLHEDPNAGERTHVEVLSAHSELTGKPSAYTK